jgi:hypothetical protein
MLSKLDDLLPAYLRWFIYLTRGLYHIADSKLHTEQAGIANLVGTSTHRILELNLAYELLAQSVSVIVQTPQEIMLGRNINFASEISPLIRNVTYNGFFQKNGVVQYQGVMFAGMTGIFTGMRPHKFAISVNSQPVGVFTSLWTWLRMLTFGWSPSQLLR